MKILGLHIVGDQSSAVLLDEGRIVCGVAEERFDRVKRSRNFPYQSIQYCLDFSGLKDLRELDAIAVSWNPMRHMEQINMSGFTSRRRYDPEWLYIAPNNLAQFLKEKVNGGASSFFWDSSKESAIYFVDHHSSHVAHAVFQSNFDDCACLIADEYGEFSSITLAQAKGSDIQIIKQNPFPHSLGGFYSMITEFLGFEKNSDEWKVMGATAYGDYKIFYDRLRSIVKWDSQNLNLSLELNYFNHYNMKTDTYISDQFVDMIGMSKRIKGEPLQQIHFDFAASAQRVFEETTFSILNSLHERTGSDNVALSGGCFMNSLCNGKILKNSKFKKMFIPYATGDNGSAMGAALWVAHTQMGTPINRTNYQPPTPLLGPSYSEEEIESILKKYKIKYHQLDNPALEAATLLAQGRIIGWFQGRLEFGERALGNRSILADPRDASVKDKINEAVKYREPFRPFAPSVLEEKVLEYFCMSECQKVPYMEQVYEVKKDKQLAIPAVTHNDKTARLQTVNQQSNPLFYSLIIEFEKLTGVSLVLNTSFNINNEPIVCTPSNAIRTFFSSGLDVLFLGKFKIEK